MAYEKKTWVDGSGEKIDAVNLNRMEDGVDGALPKTGGVLTGLLTLFADPVDDLDAATKKYVNELFVVGTYTGNTGTSQTITLGFTPRAVLIFPRDILFSSGTYNGRSNEIGLATQDLPQTLSGAETIRITTGGFIVSKFDGGGANVTSAKYKYIALR